MHRNADKSTGAPWECPQRSGAPLPVFYVEESVTELVGGPHEKGPYPRKAFHIRVAEGPLRNSEDRARLQVKSRVSTCHKTSAQPPQREWLDEWDSYVGVDRAGCRYCGGLVAVVHGGRYYCARHFARSQP